jgi:hypothetical protein
MKTMVEGVRGAHFMPQLRARCLSAARTIAFAVVCAALGAAQPAMAQFVQQGPKLVGTCSGCDQGNSVALSADGNTAIVGGPGGNGAWVFTRSGGMWTQQGGKLVGTGASGFILDQGTSVALSADGNTAILGGPDDNGGSGAAWVFTRSGGVWTQQGGKLVGTGASGPIVEQGFSVSLSADGNTAIVGGPCDGSITVNCTPAPLGAAWVFTRSGGVWTPTGQ